MRTTLDLPDSLFKAVKSQAVQEGVTLKKLLARYVEAGLQASIASKSNDPALKESPPLPVAWEADGTVTPNRTNSEIFVLLEDDEIGSIEPSA